jgi:hypothetical protein
VKASYEMSRRKEEKNFVALGINKNFLSRTQRASIIKF